MSQINDLEYQWLLDAGATPADLNDMWLELLVDRYGQGHLNDLKMLFWLDGGEWGPPVAVNWDTQPDPPDGRVGQSYNYNLRPLLNTGAQVLITSAGNPLPDGIVINGLRLQGTPTADGSFAGIQLTAINPTGTDTTLPFDIDIEESGIPEWITQPTPPVGQEEVFFSYDLAPHLSFTNSVVLSLVGAPFPPGLGFGPFTIEGTPLPGSEGDYPGIIIRASTPFGFDDTDPFQMSIGEASVVWTSTPNPPPATVGVPFNYNLAPHLSSTEDVVVTIDGGILPDGLSIVGLTIAGITAAVEEQIDISLLATNPTGSDVSNQFDMVSQLTMPNWNTQPVLPDGQNGQAYFYNLQQHLNTTDGVTLSIAGEALPDGLIIDGFNITGNPLEIGLFSDIRFRAENSTGEDISESDIMRVDPAPPVWLTDPAPPPITVGDELLYDLNQHLSTPNVTISLDAGALPLGIVIDNNLNALVGTPVAPQEINGIQLRADNISGSDDSGAFSMTTIPNPPVWLQTPDPPSGAIGEPYVHNMGQYLNTVFATFAESGNPLPAGLEMAGRLLQGTPEDEAATTGHTVTATNSEGVAESGPFNITIIEIPDVPVWTSPITPPQGQVGQQYNYNLQAHLNTDIATISVVGGSLPDGLNIVGLSIEGTPTADGDFTGITLEASNTQGADISDPFSIEIIVASVQWITQPAPPDGIEGDPYLYNLAPHLNFTDDVVITVSAGFLPDGIDVVDLALQGIPTEPGEQTGIQLTATNPGGDDESDAFSIDIESVFFSGARLDDPVQNDLSVFDDGLEDLS